MPSPPEVKDQLYLLRPGFFNATLGPLYCNDSVPVEGFLSYFPKVRELIDVHYLDFPRPRAPLVAALGEANQGMPVLIVASDRAVDENVVPLQRSNGRRYIADEKIIRRYLSQQYGLPEAG